MKVAAAALPLEDYAPCVDNKDTQDSDAVFSNLSGSQYQMPFKQRLPQEEWFTCHTHTHLDGRSSGESTIQSDSILTGRCCNFGSFGVNRVQNSQALPEQAYS